MAEGVVEYAVFGTSPFALLLAGLLKSVHGKRVAVVGPAWSPYRLPRAVDLSVMPATRPETWALLKAAGAETQKLLAGIGRGLVERVDPLFVAETPVRRDYMGHMRWIALGSGVAAEPAVDRTLAADGTIVRIRDAAVLIPGRIEPALEAWLDKLEVSRLPADTALAFPRNGRPTLTHEGRTLEAETVILADDEAILARLAEADRHRLLAVRSRMSVVTELAKPLSASLVHYLDREIVIQQRGKGPVTAFAGGDPDSAAARIGASLPGQGRLRRTGQSLFRTVATLDDAPLIGRMGKGKALVVAGLGTSAAFLAPAVARFLCGAASESETQFFTARETAKAAGRASVADAPVAELAS